MNKVNKEQIFFFVTLVIVGYMAYNTWTSEFKAAPPSRGKAKEMPSIEPVPLPLRIDPVAFGLFEADRDLFQEPREWNRLDPPRLGLPPLDEPSPLAPPFPRASDAEHWHWYRATEAALLSARLSSDVGGDEDSSTGGSGGDDETLAEPQDLGVIDTQDDLSKRRKQWDWVVTKGNTAPLFGLIKNESKWDLLREGRLDEDVDFDILNKNGQLRHMGEIPRGNVEEIHFADTPVNRFQVERREASRAGVNLQARYGFLKESWGWAKGESELHPYVAEECASVLELATGTAAQAMGHDLGEIYALLGEVRGEMLDREGELSAYKAGLERGLENAKLQKQYGTFLARYGLLESATEALRAAVEIDASDPEARMALGGFLLDRGLGAQAILEFEEASTSRRAVGRSKVDAICGLARAQLFVGDLVSAESSVRRALSLSGSHPEAFMIQAGIQYAKRDFPAASSILAELLASGENASADAHFGYALTQLRQGRVDGVEGRLQEAAFSDPLNADRVAHARAYLAWLQGRDVEAVEHCREALNLNPENPYGLYLMGRALRKTGSLDQAIGFLRGSLELEGRSVDTLKELGFTSLLLNEAANAEIYLKEALEKEPKDLEALAAMAQARLAQDDVRGAKDFYLTMRGIDEKAPVPLIGIAYCEFGMGETDGALADFGSAVTRSGDENVHGSYAADAVLEISRNLSQEQWLDRFAFTTLGNGWEPEDRYGVQVEATGAGVELRGRVEASQQGVRSALWRDAQMKSLVVFEADIRAKANHQGRYGLLLVYETGSGDRTEPALEIGVALDEVGRSYRFVRTKQKEDCKWEESDLPKVDSKEWVRLRIERLLTETTSRKYMVTIDGKKIGDWVVLEKTKTPRLNFRAMIFSEADPGQNVAVESRMARIVREKDGSP